MIDECRTGVFRSSIPPCNCENGSYDDNINSDCVQCPFPYKVALCSSSTVFIECKIGFQRSLNIMDCGCNDGFYDDGVNADCV